MKGERRIFDYSGYGCDERLLGKVNEAQTAVKYLSKVNGKNSTRGERGYK